jgi:hypothetical protein
VVNAIDGKGCESFENGIHNITRFIQTLTYYSQSKDSDDLYSTPLDIDSDSIPTDGDKSTTSSNNSIMSIISSISNNGDALKL